MLGLPWYSSDFVVDHLDRMQGLAQALLHVHAGLHGAVRVWRERLEMVEAVRQERVFLAQDGVLHGEVPALLPLLHVCEACLDAVELLAELGDFAAQVHGVLPDLLEPVEEDGEEVADVREGREDHACDGLCGKFMESKSVKLKK